MKRRFVWRSVYVSAAAIAAFAIVLGSVAKEPQGERATKAADQAPASAKDFAMGLEAKREELKAKEAALEEHERKLKEREGSLDSKIKELETLRAAISGEIELQKKSDEERVAKMVTVFETMTPKASAGVLEGLDDVLAMDILKKMDSKRMAKIMNVMDKARSARLSEMTTGYAKPISRASSVAKGSTAPTGAAEQRSPAGQAAAPQPAAQQQAQQGGRAPAQVGAQAAAVPAAQAPAPAMPAPAAAAAANPQGGTQPQAAGTGNPMKGGKP